MQNTEGPSEDSKRALITGGGGLLARFMAAELKASGWRVFVFDRSGLDISSEDDVRAGFAQCKPHLVVNCAATADVDRCEREPAWAYAVNEKGPRLLARNCRNLNADLIHVSTDYVFDGAKVGLYTQEDQPNPLSVYGHSKLAGEIAVRDEMDRFFIVRTSWIFGPGGKNFGSRVIELARQGAHLRAVTDQTSIPTYSSDLAFRIHEIIQIGAHGLYHITNASPTTWHEFARLALDLAGLQHIEIEPVSRKDLGQAAPRPRNTPMGCLASEKLGLAPLRDWRAALEAFVTEHETREPAALV